MSVCFETYESGIAVLKLNRADVMNALDIASVRKVRTLLQQYQENPELRCLIVTGEGNKAFCAGADLKNTPVPEKSYVAAMFEGPCQAADDGIYIRLMDWNDLHITKPIIAAINGYCLGGGLEIALQCDLRIASVNASFGLPEVRVGSIPGVSGVHRLIQSVGLSVAMHMVLTGERIRAERALQVGLISEVMSADTLFTRAMDIALCISKNAPLAVQAVKKLSRQTRNLTDAQAQELTELYWGGLRDTADRAEGRIAFAEKRDPEYKGH